MSSKNRPVTFSAEVDYSTLKMTIEIETYREYFIYSLQLSNHLVALLQQNSGISDELINDSLGRLLLVDNGGNLAHQVGTGIVQSVIIDIIGQVLHIVLDGDDTLSGELLNLIVAVLLPVDDVRVLANTEGTTLYPLLAA